LGYRKLREKAERAENVHTELNASGRGFGWESADFDLSQMDSSAADPEKSENTYYNITGVSDISL